ncbi:TPA: DUF551 domain-containing protein [Salmonella enterica]
MTTITNKKQYPSEQYLNELITNMEFAAMAPVEVVRVMAAELQERRKAESEPAGYHVIKECGKVGCSVATLEEAEKTRDFWNKKWTIRPYFYSAPPVVPPAIEPDYKVIKSILPTANPDEYACCIAADMWNACRDAMLQDNQRDLSQPVDPQVADYEKTMLQAGNSPVSPDGWISCSERMPDNDEYKPIAIFTGKCLGQGMFVATYDDDGFFDYWEGMEIIGVSHWMPLPAAPEPEQS